MVIKTLQEHSESAALGLAIHRNRFEKRLQLLKVKVVFLTKSIKVKKEGK